MLSMPRVQVQSLVRELRSHKPHSVAKKKKKRERERAGTSAVLLTDLYLAPSTVMIEHTVY